MPTAGDSYTVTLKEAHLGWGTYRYTDSRHPIIGEVYFPIPSQYARQFGIYNSNYNNIDTLGVNIFNATSSDGIYRGQVKSQGCSTAGNIFAKNISENGNLRGFSNWLNQIGAHPGCYLTVEWTSSTDVIFTIH
ncbi:hypothetical protein ACTGVN_09035 [Streptococcus suis]